MREQIIVTIDPCGRPKIEAVGFVGTSCKDKTKAIEDVFRGAAVKVTDKPELYAAPPVNEMHLGI